MQPTKPSELTWLQAQVPRDEWDKLNARRIELGLKWSQILLPAVKAFMATAKAVTKAEPIPPPTKKKTEKPSTKTVKAVAEKHSQVKEKPVVAEKPVPLAEAAEELGALASDEPIVAPDTETVVKSSA